MPPRNALIRLLLLMVALGAGLGADWILVSQAEQAILAQLQEKIRDATREIDAETMSSQTMGTALLLGINEPLLKEAAQGKRPADAPEVLERMQSATRLVQADGTYVMNDQGMVVAHDSKRISFTGKNLAFRPYWQQGISGRHNVYAAVGTTSDERGLYVAAPLYATNKTDSPVIGVVVIKQLADYLDQKLAALGSQALLLSPQSVVFASSNPAWLYHTTRELTADALAAIVKLKQFGKFFEKSTPKRLPVALDRPFAELEGVHYAIMQHPIDWHDPAGPWQLVILQDTHAWLPLSQRLLVDGLCGLGSALLVAFFLLRRQAHQREQLAQAALQIVHRQLEEHANQLETMVAQRTQDLLTSQDKLENLIATGLELGRELNRMALLRKILFSGRDLLHCDAGTLYLVTTRKTLTFAMRTNATDLPAREIPLYDEEGKPVERFISTWCALHNVPLIIDDIYQETRFDVSGTKRFDALSGYRTVSMLAVPLAPRNGEVIAVLQFLNKLDPESGNIVPFSPELLRFVSAMAAQAAVALDNARLLESQQKLMDALIQLIAGAIDTKSPYTGGHCERVPELGIMLAEEAGRVVDGELAEFRFATEEEWREFRIGAWLHDCGKVTTPEYVVDKGSKLETLYNRIHEVRTRFEVLLRDAMIRRLEAIADGGDVAAETERFEARKAQLLDDFAFVAECNLGDDPMTPERLARLQRIAAEAWWRHFDDRIGLSHVELDRFTTDSVVLPVRETLLADKPEHVIPRTEDPVDDQKYGFQMKVPDHLYNNGELYNLSILRGTLTEEERFKINEHVIQTIIMLEQLPLPEEMARVPEYAGAHHETLTGTGYPRKLKKEQLSIPARIMVIADIFEALTASDRPYKKAKKLSEAVKILFFFKKDGHIDPDLFDLFLRTGVYKRYADKYLRPDQIDAVDVTAYLS